MSWWIQDVGAYLLAPPVSLAVAASLLCWPCLGGRPMLSNRPRMVRVGSWHFVPACRAWLRPFWGRVSGWVDV